MVNEKRVRTLLCCLSLDLYSTLRYYGISIQGEYDIWETGEDTTMRPPWRSTIYASILWYNNTRIWYMRNRWGHFYAASVKVYYTLRYYGISIQGEYDIWETGEDTTIRRPWLSNTRLVTIICRIIIQEEYDMWETSEDTPIRPPWRSLYASIMRQYMRRICSLRCLPHTFIY